MKTVEIRFYEELNDFLPESKRKISYTLKIKGPQSVKDLIEAQGVPHTEVDLVIANGKSVDFSYKVNDGDYISVYPEFESIDISGAVKLKERPLRNTKFILDDHLYKLARYLRFAGFDCIYDKALTDSEIICISLKDKRTVLSRDVNLLKHSELKRAYWLRSQNASEQLWEVFKRFDLKDAIKPFSRCSLCNGEIIPVDKSRISDKILPGTLKYFNDFFLCNECGKVYWKGSHYENILNLIKNIISDL